MTSTFIPIACPCGCGTTVTMEVGGFAATTVTVMACPTKRAEGIVSYEVRKSAALAGFPKA